MDLRDVKLYVNETMKTRDDESPSDEWFHFFDTAQDLLEKEMQEIDGLNKMDITFLSGAIIENMVFNNPSDAIWKRNGYLSALLFRDCINRNQFNIIHTQINNILESLRK